MSVRFSADMVNGHNEGERDQEKGKVWYNGEWWDEVAWRQYVYDHEDGLDARSPQLEQGGKIMPTLQELLEQLKEDRESLAPEVFSEKYPGHTCGDNRHLGCLACLKWTGDAFATIRQDQTEASVEKVEGWQDE